MQDTILKRLETDRKALLDLSLRNALLSYRPSKARGVKVINEQSQSVYDLLVNQGKKLQFDDNGKKDDDAEDPELPELSEEEKQKSFTDNKLQTQETAKNLQKRLLKTYYDANSSIQEQGVNILFLALGFLNWYEDDTSNDLKQAPLVLVPVELERQSSNDKFKLMYTKADVESNLSLQEKLKADFGMKIPLQSDQDYASIEAYFQDVEKSIRDKKRWQIDRDAIYLGFFSFGKFLLFQDLSNDAWPEGTKPIDHPILKALLDTGFADAEPSIGDDVFLDGTSAAANLLQVLDADSTQVQAMLAVDEGRNLIIQGPPGTGKSQTITNIIANAIGKGKKVLFVAEKLAALEVVKRRLNAVQLGDACLELHSHKTNKKDLLKELSRTLELGKPDADHLKVEARQTELYKTELNNYCTAINEPVGNSGKSPFQLMGSLYRQRLENESDTLKTLAFEGIENQSSDWLRNAVDLADRIESMLKNMGIPSTLPFWGSKLKVVLPPDLKKMEQSIKTALEKHQILHAEIEAISNKCSIAQPKTNNELARCLVLFEMASKAPRLDDTQVESANWLSQETFIRKAIQSGKQASTLSSKYASSLIPEAWQAVYTPLHLEIKAHGQKWWRFLIVSYKKALKTMNTWCKSTPPNTYATRLALLEDLMTYRALLTQLEAADKKMQEYFPKSWQGKDSDWASLEERSNFILSIHKAIMDGTASRDLLQILTHITPSAARQTYDSLELAHIQYTSSCDSLLQMLEFENTSALQNGKAFGEWTFKEQSKTLGTWAQNSESLLSIASWNSLSEKAAEESCSFLIKESETWPDASSSLSQSLQKTWNEFYLQKAFKERRPLQQFDQSTHNTVLEKFVKGDLLVQQYHREKAALEHFNKLPSKMGGGQVATLFQEFNKKSRHKPIRKLIDEAGTAIQAIKPVFMMSPLSVANYLAPGTISFDLVIFDEASQVRPVDAFGAILRGKQLVVVGDTKQLPPTSFFDKMVMEESTDDDDDDSYSATADMPSILSMCNAQRAPERMLRWHYRSRHESLISVSNYEFYDSRLVIFPSPGEVNNLGLVLHHLPNTSYDRGGARTNKLEAEAIAAAVIFHATHYKDKSLGVVAFSEAQKQAVMDAIESRRKQNPALETFFSPAVQEPFFVKNLESVQGDERDVIMISVGYGKDASGYMTMSFGPLNNDGGEKRLNVLITRAKERCEVFTNLTHDDIDLERTKGLGVKAFKTFLKFAATGILDVPVATGKEADSPFEEAVCTQLERLGYLVRKQVGSNGFFIDLAIEDAETPGKYLIGIECDGAAYHSSRSARDRDRLRQSALEGMGWTFHRIWSTDWFRHPDAELKKLVAAIEKAKLKKPVELLQKSVVQEPIALHRSDVEAEVTLSSKYVKTILPAALRVNNDEFHLHPTERIMGWLVSVVRIESPVHIEEATRRLVEAAGLSRVGVRIRAAVLAAVQLSKKTGYIDVRGDFLWNIGMTTAKVRDRSELPNASRKMKFIAPEEISQALFTTTKNAFSINEDALIAESGKLFGFARITEEMSVAIGEVLLQNLKDGRLVKERDSIKIRGKS